jgi:hypothetical protein
VTEQIETVAVRKTEVEDDQRRLGVLDRFGALGVGLRDLNRVALVLENDLEKLADQSIVFDDQDG